MILTATYFIDIKYTELHGLHLKVLFPWIYTDTSLL